MAEMRLIPCYDFIRKKISLNIIETHVLWMFSVVWLTFSSFFFSSLSTITTNYICKRIQNNSEEISMKWAEKKVKRVKSKQKKLISYHCNEEIFGGTLWADVWFGFECMGIVCI